MSITASLLLASLVALIGVTSAPSPEPGTLSASNCPGKAYLGLDAGPWLSVVAKYKDQADDWSFWGPQTEWFAFDEGRYVQERWDMVTYVDRGQSWEGAATQNLTVDKIYKCGIYAPVGVPRSSGCVALKLRATDPIIDRGTDNIEAWCVSPDTDEGPLPPP